MLHNQVWYGSVLASYLVGQVKAKLPKSLVGWKTRSHTCRHMLALFFLYVDDTLEEAEARGEASQSMQYGMIILKLNLPVHAHLHDWARRCSRAVSDEVLQVQRFPCCPIACTADQLFKLQGQDL